MSRGHGSSRRQAYGRRMKDLRTRRGPDIDIDLDGPDGWNRGGSWEGEHVMHRPALRVDDLGSSAGPR